MFYKSCIKRNAQIVLIFALISLIKQQVNSLVNQTQHEISLETANNGQQTHHKSLTYKPFKVGTDIYTERQFQDIYKHFFPQENYDQEGKSISDITYRALEARYHAQVYNDFLLHRYDNFEDLKISGGPKVDQEKCLLYLSHLNERADKLMSPDESFQSKDVNLYRLFDTFGSVPSGQLIGYNSWTGSYEECLRLKIDVSDSERVPTRYCIAAYKHNSWPKDSRLSQILEIKLSVCLPKVCDSLNYKDKFALIQKLTEFQNRRIDKDQGKVTDLYCLPDEESSLRIWWQAPKTAATVSFFVSWILLLIYSTYKYNKYLEEEKQFKDKTTERINGYEKKPLSFRLQVYKSLSITNNLSQLFSTSKPQSLQIKENKSEKLGADPSIDLDNRPVVDLSILEGMKVVAMCYVICGHVLMCTSMIIGNSRELAQTNSISFLMANLLPAFAVNTFFTITGLLTSYLMFKQNQALSLITNPIKWFAFLAYRYLRIMPMYVVVVMYSKYLAKYMSSGPFWDYATSALSTRRNCENESWLWTLLFAANFKPPLDHCIPSAWYLANDFQFFIITPIFLAILSKKPEFGKLLLKICIFAGYASGFYSMMAAEIVDIRPVFGFMTHGFKTYVTHLSASYTRPQYRIPAYLCGLLFGYILYQFEQNKITFLNEKSKNPNRKEEEEEEETSKQNPEWSESFQKHGPSISLALILICVVSPTLTSYLKVPQLISKILTSLCMPAYHVAFALSVGLYILLATTGSGIPALNKCLASPIWKPLARLSLCAVLINIEVIIYVTQSFTQLQHFEGFYLLAMDLLCIALTYMVSIVVCVLFESPLRGALGHFLSFMMKKKQKSD